MTRINAHIPPVNLCDQHLLAEHREIVRIPNTIKSGKAKIDKIPDTFKLGSGHVKFFYNKLLYLKNRYNILYDECVKRGFNVTNYSESFDDLDDILYNDWCGDIKSNNIVKERIIERLSKMKNIKYYRKDININDIVKKL